MEQEWSYLVEEYRAMLYRIAFSNMKNRADAEDAVQEAFLRYMKDEKPIQNKEHEKAWLIRTTIHICLDILKSGWYQRTVPWNESFENAAKNIYLPYQARVRPPFRQNFLYFFPAPAQPCLDRPLLFIENPRNLMDRVILIVEKVDRIPVMHRQLQHRLKRFVIPDLIRQINIFCRILKGLVPWNCPLIPAAF